MQNSVIKWRTVTKQASAIKWRTVIRLASTTKKQASQEEIYNEVKFRVILIHQASNERSSLAKKYTIKWVE